MRIPSIAMILLIEIVSISWAVFMMEVADNFIRIGTLEVCPLYAHSELENEIHS